MRHLGVLALALALARVAHADGNADAQAKADVFFQKGQQDYEQKKFQAAIELFKDAYELVHDPVYLFNIAQSYRKAADCMAASDYYGQYLKASPSASNAETVKQWLRELAPCVQQQRKRELEAAKRAEQLVKRGKDSESVAETPAVEPDGGQSLRLAGLAIGSVGALGLVIGVAETVRGRSLQDALASTCRTACTYDQIKSIDDQGHRANTFAVVGYVAGGAALATGVGLYLLGRSKAEHVVVAPTPGGALVGARASW